MQMNTFTHERGTNENQAQYKARRALAKNKVECMTLTGSHSVHGGESQRATDRKRAASLRADGELKPHRRFADVLMASWARKRREARQA